MEEFDLVIIGAGSAGCVAANIFSKDRNLKILILEAGPTNLNPIIKIPLGYGMTFYNKSLNWNFFSTSQNKFNNRIFYIPRGKVVGGSSSINAMVYTRGFKSDFINWSYENSSLWSWKNILTTYEIMEKKINNTDNSPLEGRIAVNNVSLQHHKILNNYFLGAKELGIKFADSLNHEGVGHYNITSRNGYRCSSADAFLKETLKKNNVKLITKANVQKLLLEDRKVIGLKYLKNNEFNEVKVNLGVVMAAGSVKTPHILMHSGIGPSKELNKYDIKIRLDNDNVGSNLQDHIGLDYSYRSNIKTLNQELGTAKGRIESIIQYLLFRSGPFSLSLNQGGGFIRWKNKENYPNLQIYFNPISYSLRFKNKRPLLKTDKFPGFRIGFSICRPKSVGKISINSNNVNDNPIIDPKYLSNESDIYDVECGFDFIRKLSSTNSIKKVLIDSVNIDPLRSSDDQMKEHFKDQANTVFHPCGTCKMGQNKQNSVVSHKLKVHGMENLWIVDASVFPNITSGNINAPVMMVAYNGSNIISENIKKI